MDLPFAGDLADVGEPQRDGDSAQSAAAPPAPRRRRPPSPRKPPSSAQARGGLDDDRHQQRGGEQEPPRRGRPRPRDPCSARLPSACPRSGPNDSGISQRLAVPAMARMIEMPGNTNSIARRPRRPCLGAWPPRQRDREPRAWVSAAQMRRERTGYSAHSTIGSCWRQGEFLGCALGMSRAQLIDWTNVEQSPCLR